MTIIVLGGKITAYDLINVQDTGKPIPDFITDKSGQTQQLSTNTDQSTAADDTADPLYKKVQPMWGFDFNLKTLKRKTDESLCLPVWDKNVFAVEPVDNSD